MGFKAENRWHGQMRKFHLHLNDTPNHALMTNQFCGFSSIKFGWSRSPMRWEGASVVALTRTRSNQRWGWDPNLASVMIFWAGCCNGASVSKVGWWPWHTSILASMLTSILAYQTCDNEGQLGVRFADLAWMDSIPSPPCLQRRKMFWRLGKPLNICGNWSAREKKAGIPDWCPARCNSRNAVGGCKLSGTAGVTHSLVHKQENTVARPSPVDCGT